MKTPISVLFVLTFICFLVIVSCKKKSKPPKCDGRGSTYNFNIRPLITSNCGSSGCHPNYTTYRGLQEVLNNGKFREKVIETKDMPKGSSMSSDDLIKIRCWADAGFPEN